MLPTFFSETLDSSGTRTRTYILGGTNSLVSPVCRSLHLTASCTVDPSTIKLAICKQLTRSFGHVTSIRLAYSPDATGYTVDIIINFNRFKSIDSCDFRLSIITIKRYHLVQNLNDCMHLVKIAHKQSFDYDAPQGEYYLSLKLCLPQQPLACSQWITLASVLPKHQKPLTSLKQSFLSEQSMQVTSLYPLQHISSYQGVNVFQFTFGKTQLLPPPPIQPPQPQLDQEQYNSYFNL